MKILQINPYPPENLGGSELFCKNLSLNLSSKENFECDILTSDFLKRNVKIDFLSNKKVKVIYKQCLFNFWGKNPVVNIFSFLNNNYFNYDIIHIHAYPFFTSIQAALLKKIRKFPLILHLHGFEINSSLSSGFNAYEKLQLFFKNHLFDKYVGKLPIKAADAIISVTKRDLYIVKKKYNLHSF